MAAKPPPFEEYLYLLTRPSLSSALDFFESFAVDAAELDRGALADQWRAAQAAMEELQESESGWADECEVHPLPDEFAAMTHLVESDPIFQRAYSDVKPIFALVELDRLVIFQQVVCLPHLTRLEAKLGAEATPEDLFRFCLPYDHPNSEVRAGRIEDDAFAFVSESNDLRFLEAVMLRPDQIQGYQASGPIAGVLALVVGFGSNYLNVIEANGRLVLNNGYHRACALRAMGLSHVPCIVQQASTEDEERLLLPRAVRKDRERYLEQARPPVLKDYFDNRLVAEVRLAMSTKEIRLKYSVEETDLP